MKLSNVLKRFLRLEKCPQCKSKNIWIKYYNFCRINLYCLEKDCCYKFDTWKDGKWQNMGVWKIFEEQMTEKELKSFRKYGNFIRVD